jgi:hypothetical protein
MKIGNPNLPLIRPIEYEAGDPGRFYLAVGINPEQKTDPGNLKHP